MTRLTRKQRELKEREALILRVAGKMLVRDGYFGLSMDRLAEATEYAKGTIYQHFNSREEVIVGLATTCLQQRGKLLERVAALGGRPRERFLSLWVAHWFFCEKHREYPRTLLVVKNPAFQGRARVDRLQSLSKQDTHNRTIALDIIQEACANGDLSLAGDSAAPELLDAVHSQALGGLLSGQVPENGRRAALDVRPNLTWIERLLDSVGWRPLSDEYDLDAIIARTESAL